jgi:hypothetical protein
MFLSRILWAPQPWCLSVSIAARRHAPIVKFPGPAAIAVRLALSEVFRLEPYHLIKQRAAGIGVVIGCDYAAPGLAVAALPRHGRHDGALDSIIRYTLTAAAVWFEGRKSKSLADQVATYERIIVSA